MRVGILPRPRVGSMSTDAHARRVSTTYPVREQHRLHSCKRPGRGKQRRDPGLYATAVAIDVRGEYVDPQRPVKHQYLATTRNVSSHYHGERPQCHYRIALAKRSVAVVRFLNNDCDIADITAKPNRPVADNGVSIAIRSDDQQRHRHLDDHNRAVSRAIIRNVYFLVRLQRESG